MAIPFLSRLLKYQQINEAKKMAKLKRDLNQ